MSAKRSRSVGVDSVGVLSAIPMLTVTPNSRPSMMSGARNPARSRAARRLRQFDPLTEQDREFIATEPRQRIAVAQRALQASRRRDQQLIPDGVAEAVVDRLEAIEIEEEDGTAP